jgi:phage tail sheath protein FI
MVKKYSTPGVYATEKDLSEIISPAGTSVGGIVVRAPQGPVNRLVLTTTDKDYIDKFAKPVFTSGSSLNTPEVPEYGYGSYAAISFLQESDGLYVFRAPTSGDLYATISYATSGATTTSGIQADTSPTVLDKIDSIKSLDDAARDVIMFGPLGPGVDGNNIGVSIEVLTSASDWRYQYDDYSKVSAWPVDSDAIAKKVVKVEVYRKTDAQSWSEVSATAASEETYYGTITAEVDGNNSQLQLSELINGNSNYIYAVINSNGGSFDVDNFNDGTDGGGTVKALAGGAAEADTGLTSTDGWDFFKEKEDVDVNILICPSYSTTQKQKVEEVTDYRKDCIAVMQSGEINDNTVTEVLAAESYGYVSPSYVALYAGWDLKYDSYNDRKVYLPKCIEGAMAMARTDAEANVWDAPAGMSRGGIRALDQNKVWSQTEIGQLYDRNINTSRFFRNVGNVLWGQKTAQMKKSALDRINVRRNLLFMEDSIETSIRPFVLDITNTAKNRLRVWSIVNSFMESVKAAGGVTDYNVVCDETNNTAQVIDSNQLAVDIYVKPVRVVEFITLQMVVTSSGVNLTEIAA